MDKNTSIYLDAVRFIAACLVLIYHTSGIGITGGFLWQLGHYGPPAVIVFFVLSGYVIGFVSNTKETTLTDYSTARLSRLYSIILPALVITWLCNELGDIYISAEYTGPWNQDSNGLLRNVASLLMLQNVWLSDFSPTNNGSFWSLSYEFFYYVIFAGLFYLKGKARWAVVLVAMIIAGPAIVALAPLWGLGYLAYQINVAKRFKLSPTSSIVLFSLGLIAFAASPTFSKALSLDVEYIKSSTAADYIVGVAFFAHLLGAPYVATRFSTLLLRCKKIIVSTSSLTFALYLFHLPLVRLFAGVSPFIEQPGSWQNISFVYLSTLTTIVLLGYPAEKSKRWYKSKMQGSFSQLKLGKSEG